MGIYTPPGEKVVFAFPDNGWPDDKETAAKHLKVGAKYTVARTVVRSCNTEVYLVEVPDVAFNSVNFANITEDIPPGTKEGDICNRDLGCDGILEYVRDGDCTCHVSPPCGSCVDAKLTCPVCFWKEDEDQ